MTNAVRKTKRHELSGPLADLPNEHWTRLFERRAAAHPERVALVTGANSMTFGELDTWSNRLAGLLRERGVRPGSVVACALPRSARAVVALLAVGKARGVYLPLDPDSPDGRLRTLLADARPRVLLHAGQDIPTTGVERVVALDGQWRSSLADRSDSPPGLGAVDAALPAYLIYTSGTSGRPKGVVVGNSGLVNLCHEVERHFRPLVAANRPVRVAHGLSLSFDASWNPFLWLFAGHEMHLLPDAVRRDPERYAAEVRARGLTVVEATATMVAELVAHGLLDQDPVPSLVLIGGERIGRALWTRLREHPGVTAVNLYGPTESTVFATWYTTAEGTEPLLGRLVANSCARVVDEAGQALGPGEVGELWLGGAGVADRYLNQPELTERRFLTGVHRGAQVRWYRTGDRCRHRRDGTLEFLGRLDEQVKVRGHRVEPGEAESVLLERPEVRQAAVVAEEYQGQTRLVAYVVPAKVSGDLTAVLRGALREQLPDYAVPAVLTLVETMPTLPSGKLDLAALAALSAHSPAADGVTAPRTETEKLLAQVWGEVLGIAEPDVHADFFELGGHSLLAARVAARLRRRAVDCSLRDVLRCPTVATLAEHLDTRGRTS
ncbi:amino acid adenylation domain-containing protein [Crossiella equi]|uniref:Amino acid adenylation domain-containing protein n=1 Tax=Crossiella equi TaxID=130796 RepID=A0ABS5AT30_9PSEU|nr:non-ribosomal peptide synthetase [Crossiella equi]MBP2479716.1 amino acid adenylation domain-containing protein [Crossiella equi]